MPWYSLRIDGMSYDRATERRVSFLSGGASLEAVLQRLQGRMTEAVDETGGSMSNGLMAALTAQLSLGQWRTLSDFSRAEETLGTLHPGMSTLEAIARASCRASSNGPGRRGSTGTPPSS